MLFWAENCFNNWFLCLYLLCSFMVLSTINCLLSVVPRCHQWLPVFPAGCMWCSRTPLPGSGWSMWINFHLQSLSKEEAISSAKNWLTHRYLSPPETYHRIFFKKGKPRTVEHLLSFGSHHLALICISRYLNAFEKGTFSAFWWTSQCKNMFLLPDVWCLLCSIRQDTGELAWIDDTELGYPSSCKPKLL